MIFEQSYQPSNEVTGLEEKHWNDWTMQDLSAKGQKSEWIGTGLHLIHVHVKVNQHTSLDVSYKHTYIQLLFLLKGEELTCSFENGLGTFSLQRNEYAIFMVVPGQKRTINWAPTSEMEVFVVNVAMDAYFTKFLHIAPVENLKSSLLSGVVTPNQQMTLKMHEIISAMISLSCNAFLKKLHLETKISELVLLQIEQYLSVLSALDTDKRFTPVQQGAISKMYELRNFLHKYSNASHTLKDLARHINSNETYIKNNFKMVFGLSVFQYLNQVRMQKAQQLLSSSGISVSEVAEIVGYTHATHFTAAFKKYFGFLPKEVRR